jgi:exonuclease III
MTNHNLNISTNSNETAIITLQSEEQQNEPNLIELNLNEKINIATHNVRGINDILKMQTWIEYCIEFNLHIISITETKLKESTTKSLTNPLYKIYTSNFIPYKPNQRETSLGTALMVCNQLQPYIHKINTLPGTAICIDFFFSNNNKTCIISIYISLNYLFLFKNIQS